MKANQLATLILRLLGIYCLIVYIPVIPLLNAIFFVPSNSDGSGIPVIISIVLFLVIWLGVGILLITRSVLWGERLTKTFSESTVATISIGQIQVLAFAVAGVLIFAEALPQLLNSLSSSLNQATNNRNPAAAEFKWRVLFSATGTILKAALGLWMFFGASGFTNFWRSARNFGTPKPPQA